MPHAVQALEWTAEKSSFLDFATAERALPFTACPVPDRPVVCVQGLGFVGAAMAVAVAAAKDGSGERRFNVLGVERPGPRGGGLVAQLNAGRFPFATADDQLSAAVGAAREWGNLVATTDARAYGLASVIVIDVNLDLDVEALQTPRSDRPAVDFTALRDAVAAIGREMSPDALVILETTVPPGTCEKVVAPVLEAELTARGHDPSRLLLAHSYERVMPGPDYLESVTDYWRVFAGRSEAAADACESFLSQVVNVRDYPLRRLASTTASETAKVLENSYRAVTIAMIEEWSRFAEAVGIDLFEVIEAIRQRPTHSNIRTPGFGVGGYCLPKDPLMALCAARELHDRTDLDFPFCRMATEVNRVMPLSSLDLLEALLDGDLTGKQLLLLGVSYRPGVADTRTSPAETFAHAALSRGAVVQAHDPMVHEWPEMGIAVSPLLPPAEGLDGVVLAVPHPEYRRVDFADWAGRGGLAIVDSTDVLDPATRKRLRANGHQVAAIGRGTDVPDNERVGG